MPEFLQIVSALKEQMSASLSRSDVLRPLILLLGMSILMLIAAITSKADGWITVTAFVFFGVIVAAYLGAFFYFAKSDPDALRSEKYTLNKMAIERGMIGDNLAGLSSLKEIEKKSTAPVIEQSEVNSDD